MAAFAYGHAQLRQIGSKEKAARLKEVFFVDVSPMVVMAPSIVMTSATVMAPAMAVAVYLDD